MGATGRHAGNSGSYGVDGNSRNASSTVFSAPSSHALCERVVFRKIYPHKRRERGFERRRRRRRRRRTLLRKKRRKRKRSDSRFEEI